MANLKSTDNKLNYQSQIEFMGKMCLDPKMEPVATVADLPTVGSASCYNGATRMVIAEERMYYFDGSRWNPIVSEVDLEITGNDVEN